MKSPSSSHRAVLAGLLLLGLGIGNSGCFHTRVVNRDTPPGQTHETKGRIFLWGLASSSSAHVKTGKKCPNGIARVESERTFGDGLFGLVTLGIYTPVTIRYTCVKAAAPESAP